MTWCLRDLKIIKSNEVVEELLANYSNNIEAKKYDFNRENIEIILSY